MEFAFHIIIVIWFTIEAVGYFVKHEGLSKFLTSLILIFLAVWAWLHLFNVW